MDGDISLDREMPISELRMFFPRRGDRHPSVGRIRSWIVNGIRGVKLQGRRIGGLWYSSPAAVERWCRELNFGVPAATRPDPKRADKVRKLLIANGFLDETQTAEVSDLRGIG
jgi:hypothetical protein